MSSNENVGRLSLAHASSTCSRKKKGLEELYSCPVCYEEVEMVEDGANMNALMSVRASRMELQCPVLIVVGEDAALLAQEN